MVRSKSTGTRIPVEYRQLRRADESRVQVSRLSSRDVSEAAVSVHGLEKRYGDVEAVRGIDLEVVPGETFGFLGPNGAGKSTTINMLCTLAKPTAGTARVAGHDVVTERDAVRRNIGLVFQDTTLDGYLTAEQNLRLHAELYGVPRDVAADRMHGVMEMVGLWDRRASKVRTFSGGMRRRLEIARGLLHSPRVLFLDEPTVGLDPQTRSSIWGYIRELKRRESITIFLTTHYMDEAEHCDRIAIIDHGRIVVVDTPEALKASVGTDRVRIDTDDDEAAIAALAARFGIEAQVSEGSVTFAVESGEQFVPRLFAELGVPIRAVSVARPTLDDVFMAYTGTTIRDAEATGLDRLRTTARVMGR
jgi:ABC-2 type transport system ATP-binding protein